MSGRIWLGAVFLAAIFGTVQADAAVFKLEEATIADMQDAMAEGGVTSVELVAMYLNRINVYDRDTVKLNAVAQVNPRVMLEAAAMDKLRAEGVVLGPLHGIPVMLKDSYDVAGLAASAGALPVKNLMAKTDAPVVKALKDAGAVILGKTNMWPFAYRTEYDPPLRFAWGLVKNPYTLVDDFGGSSTGSAAAVAANLCAFAMGGDTGSSIRLPSARTALVGGRPTLFLVPGSGTWPANVSLDVLGPMARTVTDCAIALDAVVFDDPNPVDTGFFPPPSTVRPVTYTQNLSPTALAGKVVGLPRPYIGKDPEAKPLDPVVEEIWETAVAKLQEAGATVKEIDWPFYHNIESTVDSPATYLPLGLTEAQFKEEWEFADAFYFDEHLKSYGDPAFTSVFDLPSPTVIEDPQNHDKIGRYKKIFTDGEAKSFADLNYAPAFAAYAAWAKRDIEDVMIAEGVDLVAFPTAGWGDASEDVDDYEMLNATMEGTKLGLPQFTVPMGFTGAGSPQGMMIMARTFYSEAEILGFAYAFEQVAQARRPPPLTPALPGETIEYGNVAPPSEPEKVAPRVRIRGRMGLLYRAGSWRFEIAGRSLDESPLRSVNVFVNGRKVGGRRGAEWSVEVPWRKLWRLVRPGERVVDVMVLAKDVNGNTGADTAKLRVPRGQARG